MIEDGKTPQAAEEDDGVVDHAATAVEDVVEDLLNLDREENPTPGPPATSRG